MMPTVLPESEDLEAIFKNSIDGILISNMHGNVTVVNRSFIEKFGYASEDELIGKKVEQLFTDDILWKNIHQQLQNRSIGNENISPDIVFAVKKNGEIFPVEVRFSFFKKRSNQFILLFITDIFLQNSKLSQSENDALNKNISSVLEIKTQNITQKLISEIDGLKLQIREMGEEKAQLDAAVEELRHLLDKEKELGLIKSIFVSTASHEFRTPLSSIISSVDLLSKYTTSEDQLKRDKHLQRIKSSTRLLIEILNDFLSLEKMEEGKIEVNKQVFNLREFTEELIGELQVLAKKGQVFSFVHEGDDGVFFDRVLLKHIMVNLISNAVKFSPENSTINVLNTVVNNQLIIRIKDKGIGISVKDQEHLFERFYRASNAAHIQGTGLGLHLVGKYVEMLNGEIICKSEADAGTEFILRFGLD